MSPHEYADKLVEEYQHIIESETSLAFAYCRTAAIKCAIKQVEERQENYIRLTWNTGTTKEKVLTYLKSLL